MRTLTIAFIALLLCPGPARAETPTVLFRWTDDRCARWDIPDAPARAWRDAAGRIRLLAAAEVARTSVGPDLLTLRRDCAVRFVGRGNADPSIQDDRIWIASILARGGHQIDAIGHAEFHGHDHPGACYAGDYISCWRNALVALQSRDGGESFQRMPGPPIARLPYRYDPTQRGRSGYFNPSNMIERAGFTYLYFFAEAYKAQQRGVCVARRSVDGAPDSWHFWDGVGFNGRFADPYAAAVLHPERHVCAPLPGLSATLSSVVLQPETERYLAVSPGVRQGVDGTRRTGIWALQSADLLHWTDAVLLADLPLLWARDCDDDYAYAYPSLIDPNSQDRNFGTVDTEFWLTFVRIRLDDRCKTGPERDLLAVGVSWPGTPGALPVLQARSRGWPDPAR